MSLPDITDPRIAAFFAVYVAVMMLAWVLGGAPEKRGVYTFLAMFAAQLALYSVFSDPRFDEIDAVAIASDAIGVLGFVAIALNANRLWPMFAAAMQLISVLAHLTHGFQSMLGQSYADFKVYPTAVAILVLLVGVALHRYRLHVHGYDRDWVPFKRYTEFRRIAKDSEQF